MEDEELKTVNIHECIARHRQGDPNGMHDLICLSSKRLEKIARKITREFPDVNCREQSEDVLQEALISLSRALHEVTPKSVRHFFGLASTQIRRELLSLTRKYKRRFQNRELIGFNISGDGSRMSDRNPADRSQDLEEDLDRWEEFHRAVDKLEGRPREVFSLTYYGGLNQMQIAELLQCSDRHVRRYLSEASELIRQILGSRNLPSP